MIKNIYLEKDGFRLELTLQAKSVATYGEMQHLTEYQENRFRAEVLIALNDLIDTLKYNEEIRKELTEVKKENKNEEAQPLARTLDDDISF